MNAQQFLNKLNKEYANLHKEYEDLFWVSYMGNHTVDKKKDEALARRDAFRGSEVYLAQAEALAKRADAKTRERLKEWIRFFKQYQIPKEALALKDVISQMESAILKKKAERKEGYIDPTTNEFIPASELKMRTMVRTASDERVRKACFGALEGLATTLLAEYVEMVKLRNQYARMLGYTDFYDFKLRREDGMTKKELFDLFDTIYQYTKYSFADIRKMEKMKPGLRKPWNFSYMLSGNFIKEEDPYLQFSDALLRWGRSFAALGIDLKGGSLMLDLLDRKGKWGNGFCHWPNLVRYESGRRISGSSNFTCNVVAGQVGSGMEGYRTLFHEGGHAAHLLTSEAREVFLNHEYAPMSMSWAETQSMLVESLFGSIEWKMRYAVNQKGETYPFDLFERKARALAPLWPRQMNSIISVAAFERAVYELKEPTAEKIMHIAKKVHKKYNDFSEDSLLLLIVPHIYSWESSASYHGYGLAELAVCQWREYFYKKYGHIVDNPYVGKEMARVWKLGGAHTFPEFVKLATGKKLSSSAFLKGATMTADQAIERAGKRIRALEKVKPYTKAVNLNAAIRMMHGTREVANNKKSFEDMAKKYQAWVLKQAQG